MHLEGVALGDRAERVADNWAGRLETERSFYAFNDAHAMMAFTIADREVESAQLLADLGWTIEHGAGVNRMMTHDVGLPVCNAIRAFGRGRYTDAIAELEPVRDIAARFGGSHAQRDVLHLTLAESAIRAGGASYARAIVAERLALKPASPSNRQLAERARALA
jgi:hypothetical protein